MAARTCLPNARAWLAMLICMTTMPAFGGEPGLAVLMERMQTYTHKLQLSIDARNAPLAHFYLHELEETSEFVADTIEHYDDYPVGALVREMLLPRIEQLEDVTDAVDWPAGDSGLTDLIGACNACHVATGHGHIRITPADSNPFAQDFAVSGE
ncbi:MAG TPA: hypothetical protein VMQ83_01120 [Gammaproteobacteria bacterium]|nr:hypothetical protein [Gammaproteobacteria bacterium]